MAIKMLPMPLPNSWTIRFRLEQPLLSCYVVSESTYLDSAADHEIHQIATLDNGCGMDADVLKIALQFGNGTHLKSDQQTGMGRFGMGLPSASISQCTRVEVWSWQNGINSALYTFLDVDLIRQGQQSIIPEPTLKPIPQIWQQAGSTFEEHGTLIIWSNLDRLMWRTARSIIDNSEFLVGRMYRRFLAENRVTINLVAFDMDNPSSTREVKPALPNDPGYLMPNTSTPAPFNHEPMFTRWAEDYFQYDYIIKIGEEEHVVTTRFSISKESARQGANPGTLKHGQHAGKNIGVSIVRAGRELDLDQAWTINYDPTERWWGIEIEFPPALDELFGVTNNKQAARNFSEYRQIDFDTLLSGTTIAQIKAEMKEDNDPREQLIELLHRIQVTISEMRKWLKQQTRGTRTEQQRYSNTSPESIATSATRERQEEGHQGASDRDETLPPQQRQAAIEKSLIDEGVTATAAKHLAATTVSDGLKYVFAEADLETQAFFSVKPRGGAIVITLNTNHPAYEHLVEVVEGTAEISDPKQLQDRLNRAADGLKLLLSAWARYEDEQPDGKPRSQAADARSDWGRIARNFLERE